eukprot:TRINITY_DN4720_c1_g1_i1.p1 TRINITY_DN4720_c1_g1~~TRINITY_DN4720_c1_g1_i1.p1  ORF type:complete len:609 (-),score=196.72 TRINITY_DN4720_c1_g1_i1:415-2208(-)
MEDERPPPPELSFAYRSNQGSGLYRGAPVPSRVEDYPSFPNSAKMEWSPDGEWLAVVTPERVLVLAAEDGAQRCAIERPNVLYVAWSPASSYLTTWERLPPSTVTGGAPVVQDNLLVWNAATGELIHGFCQKAFSNWPSIRWSSDEMVSARMISGQVLFFAGVNFRTSTRQIKLANVSQFAIGAGPQYHVAVFAGEKKGTPAQMRLYAYPGVAQPICSKSFFRAQHVSLHWNPAGTAVLCVSHADVDATGKSYYGETGLYYLDKDGAAERVALPVEGSVFDVAWRPDGKQFVVIYGRTPANITVYDQKREPVIEFPQAHRNTAKWAPNNHLLCIAGFGTFAGEVDFWDVKRNRKIGEMRAKDTITCDWSPDSKYFLTTTLWPRLRVDNSFKIWNYYGKLLHSEEFQELYQVSWRPMKASNFDPRPPPKVADPADLPVKEEKVEAKKSGVYRHPRYTGSGSSTFAEGQVKASAKPQKVKTAKPDTKVEAKVPVGFTPVAKKPKKKKKKGGASKEGEASPAKEAAAPAFTFDVVTSTAEADDVAKAKRVKALNKKLRQIAELKEKREAGLELNAAQITKLEGEAALLEELSELEGDKKE